MDAEALHHELHEALRLMVRVARGEQTVEAMGEWISLNFRQYRLQLPHSMQVSPDILSEH